MDAKTLLEEWTGGTGDRLQVYTSELGTVNRWLNQAQLRFADKAECLRDVWSPSIPSTGVIDLPTNFIREYKDRVKLTSYRYLIQMAYQDAQIQTPLLSGTYYYSIYNKQFYVWSPMACTPIIPYIRKPIDINLQDGSSNDLEIPNQYYIILFDYLDAMMARRKDDITGYNVLLSEFDKKAENARFDFMQKNDPVAQARGYWF